MKYFTQKSIILIVIFLIKFQSYAQKPFINLELDLSFHCEGDKAIYTQDSSWIVAANTNIGPYFYKISESGKVLWKISGKGYGSTYNFSDAIRNNNGNYVFACIGTTTCDIFIQTLFLIEISPEGAIVNELSKTISTSGNIFLFEHSGKYIIATGNSFYQSTGKSIDPLFSVNTVSFNNLLSSNLKYFYASTDIVIIKFDSTGEIHNTAPISHVNNLFYKGDTLSFVKNGKIYSFNQELTIVDSLIFHVGEIDGITDIEADSEGYWFTDSKKVFQLNKDMSFKKIWDLTTIKDFTINSIDQSNQGILCTGRYMNHSVGNTGIGLIGILKKNNNYILEDDVEIKNIKLENIKSRMGSTPGGESRFNAIKLSGFVVH